MCSRDGVTRDSRIHRSETGYRIEEALGRALTERTAEFSEEDGITNTHRANQTGQIEGKLVKDGARSLLVQYNKPQDKGQRIA